MTGKFTFKGEEDNNGNGNVQEAINQVTESYKKADRELKQELEEKISEITTGTEVPTLSQVLSQGNEMDKDIDIADGKNFNNFNLATKEVRTNSTDTDTSKLYFAGDKTILEHSNSYIDTHLKYSTQKIELDKDGISLISNFRHIGESGNPDSGSGGTTSQLDFNFNGFLLSQENNGQKTEIIKVDSEGIKTKKISQTEYSEPTDEKDYVTKKYLDEKISNQSNSFIKRGSSDDKVLLGNGGEKDLSQLENKNIQIGGRNLVIGTGKFEMLELPFYLQPNYLGNAGFVNETFRGNKVIKLIHNWQGFQCKTELENRPTIISFWAKTTKPNIYIYYIVGISSVTFPDGDTLISDGQWHRYTIFGKNGIKLYNNINNGFLEFNCTSGGHIEEVYVSSFKIEYGNTPTDWTPAPEDLESKVPQYKTIKDAHTFLDNDASIFFGSGANISNAPSSNFYEMVGFTHSNKNWGFIIAKNIDNDDKQLWVKQVIGGTYKEWFKLEDRSKERTINVTDSTFYITPDIVGKTLHINNNCTVNYNNMPLLTTVAIRKVFDEGEVKFTGSVEAIYTGDRVLNGKKGSTAIIDYSYDNNMIFIDIRNI